MTTAKKLLDKYAETCNAKNDAEIARNLKLTRGAVNNWRTGTSHPDAESIEKMATAIGEPVGTWLAQIEADRARTPAGRQVWLRLAATLGAAMALAVIALPSDTNGRPDVQTPGSMSIVSNIRRKKRRPAKAVTRWLSDTWSQLSHALTLPERLQLGSALPE